MHLPAFLLIMKVVLNNKKGFILFEVVIALALSVLALAVSASATFGAQALLVDTQMYTQAIFQAQGFLQKVAIDAQNNFNFLYSSTTQTQDSFQQNYDQILDVLDITPCIKKVDVTEGWQQAGRLQHVSLQTFITHPLYVLETGEMCVGNELLSTEWVLYQKNTFNINTNEPTDVDVVDDSIFLSYNSATSTNVDIRIFDKENPTNLISEIDIGEGVFAIDVTRDYIFVAVNSTSTQLVIIDIKNRDNPFVVTSKSLFGVNPLGSYPQARSIFFFNDRIYIGTKETAGPEFHIFDVSNPTNPIEIGFFEVTHNINDIVVRDDVAYLATSADTKELIVFDVSAPREIHEIGYFNAGLSTVNDRDATSLYLLGNTIYLGRKRETQFNPELYAIDISNSTLPTLSWSFAIGLMQPLSYVSGVIRRGNLLFVSSTDPENGFIVFDIKDTSNIKKISENNFQPPVISFDIQKDEIYAVDSFGENIFVISANSE